MSFFSSEIFPTIISSITPLPHSVALLLPECWLNRCPQDPLTLSSNFSFLKVFLYVSSLSPDLFQNIEKGSDSPWLTSPQYENPIRAEGKRETTGQFHSWTRYKNPKQNVSDQDPAMHKSSNTSQPSLFQKCKVALTFSNVKPSEVIYHINCIKGEKSLEPFIRYRERESNKSKTTIIKTHAHLKEKQTPWQTRNALGLLQNSCKSLRQTLYLVVKHWSI